MTSVEHCVSKETKVKILPMFRLLLDVSSICKDALSRVYEGVSITKMCGTYVSNISHEYLHNIISLS